MLNGPFSPWPCFDEAEKQAVLDVLDSNKVNYWTGQVGREFERQFATFTDSKHAIAVANGTVALDLALVALSLPKDAEVIVTSRSFLASVSSIVLAGLTPVFADVDADSQNLTVETITNKITSRTAAILCVHLAGWPCDMPAIMRLAAEHDLKVIEDCAQAHGAKINGQSVGSFADVSAWSFCQDKIMTTAGEGGMVTTNNTDYWHTMWSYKDHGKSWQAVYEKDHPPGFRWLHESFGTNWRMTEMQAAVGLQQIRKMPKWSELRNANAMAIFNVAKNFSCLRVPEIPAHLQHAFYKCYLFVEPHKLCKGWDRDRIIDELSQCAVPCFSGSCSEIYNEKAFDDTGFRPDEPLPIAHELAATSLMFLVHPTLSEAEIKLTCASIETVMARASK